MLHISRKLINENIDIDKIASISYEVVDYDDDNNEIYEGEVYDSGGHSIEKFYGNWNILNKYFGPEIARKIENHEGDIRGLVYWLSFHQNGNEKRGLTNAAEIISLAKEKFPKRRGDSQFLLTDGTLIGLDRGHGEIREIGVNISQFIGMGNIRLGGQRIELAKKPTMRQVSALKGWLMDYVDEPIYVDFAECDTKSGDIRVVFGAKYSIVKNPSRIVNDIIRYYDEGIKPMTEEKSRKRNIFVISESQMNTIVEMMHF